MKIYTKTGDEGSTGLFGGERVQKDHARIEAYGTVDELNAFTGLLRDHIEDGHVRSVLFTIQNTLFNIGAALATPEGKSLPGMGVDEASVLLLEKEMDDMDAALPALRNFILPGGMPAVSYAHVARTVCRRAERQTVHLSHSSPVDAVLIRYLNRLSDYFFVLSRYWAHRNGIEEVTWKGL